MGFVRWRKSKGVVVSLSQRTAGDALEAALGNGALNDVPGGYWRLMSALKVLKVLGLVARMNRSMRRQKMRTLEAQQHAKDGY